MYMASRAGFSVVDAIMYAESKSFARIASNTLHAAASISSSSSSVKASPTSRRSSDIVNLHICVNQRPSIFGGAEDAEMLCAVFAVREEAGAHVNGMNV